MVDVTVWLAIVLIGAMHYALVLRADDFFTGDTTYFELARSLLTHGGYGFNARPQTVMPPGFPAFMAALCVTVGCRHAVFVRAVVVCSTLGVLAAYELLRRLQGRAAAAVISLLLVASPGLFSLETRMVMSDLPYMLTSLLTLLLVRGLDQSRYSRSATREGRR
jgi:asparagine N-glycosylation enzyme membrane subunit Stt3